MPDFVQVVSVDDYHDFDYIAGSFKGTKVKGGEYGFSEDGKYWGIIYTGRKPKKADVMKMLSDAGFVPHPEFHS